MNLLRTKCTVSLSSVSYTWNHNWNPSSDLIKTYWDLLQVIPVLFCVDYVATDKQHINIPVLLTFAICQILEKQEPVVGQSVMVQDDQIITGFDNSKQNRKQRDPQRTIKYVLHGSINIFSNNILYLCGILGLIKQCAKFSWKNSRLRDYNPARDNMFVPKLLFWWNSK